MRNFSVSNLLSREKFELESRLTTIKVIKLQDNLWKTVTTPGDYVETWTSEQLMEMLNKLEDFNLA